MHGVLGADGLADDLADAVRDDLVRIHVRAGAGPGLVNVQDEMLIQLALSDFQRRLLDHFRSFLGRQNAEFGIGLGGGPFDEAVGVDDGVGDKDDR